MAAQKLTLSIEPDVIDKAKEYAKQKHTSISKLVQNYLKDISAIESEKHEPFRMKSEDELSDWLGELAKSSIRIPDFDHKAEYHKHLEEKYGS